MVNNSKCECPLLPTHPWEDYSSPGHQLGKPPEGVCPGLLLGALREGFVAGLHSGLALPGLCPAEIMYRLLGLQPVLKGPRPHNAALWLPQDTKGFLLCPRVVRKGSVSSFSLSSRCGTERSDKLKQSLLHCWAGNDRQWILASSGTAQ
jgi:hypothetical protein